MDMIIIITAAFLFMAYLFLHWTRNRNSPAIDWPLVGMTPTFFFNLGHLLDHGASLLKRSGGTILCKGPPFSSIKFLYTSDPANVDYILNKNCGNYIKVTPETRDLLEPLGDGVFNSEHDLWRNQRRAIHSLMKLEKFELAAERIAGKKIVEGLFPVLEQASKNGSVMDLQNLLQRFTFDVSCMLVMGFDPECLVIDLPEVAYEKAFNAMEGAFLYRGVIPPFIWKFQRWLQIGEERKLRKAWDIFDNFLYQSISRKREEPTQTAHSIKTDHDEFNLLTCFLVDKEQKYSDKFIRDTAFNLMIAGRDTVGTALSWLFWLLATHPSVESKLLKEIETNLVTNARKDEKKWIIFNFKDLNKLVYLHGAICEALRLYPSVPSEKRLSVEPDTLPSGHRLEANMKIVYSPYTMGRMEDIWGKDCLEFKPERWISEAGGIIHVPSYKFSAFGSGSRACIGKPVTFVEMKMVAAAVVWNYRLESTESHRVCPSDSVILHMKHGLKVKVFQRH